jgi:hypothetical protein
MKKSLAFLLVVAAFAASACKKDGGSDSAKSQGELQGLNGTRSSKFVRVPNEPFFVRNEFTASAAKKKTAIIYYAADTAEPYFQAAVSHEIRSLREACASKNELVNWVAFVNSHWLVKKQYMQCVSGKFSVVDMKIDKLEEIVAAIKDPSFDTQLKDKEDPRTALFSAESAVAHGKELNVQYESVPFAHPEVFRLVTEHAMTQVFPARDFVYIVNPKGHGSREFAITGLTQEQLTEKSAKQTARIKELGLDKILAMKLGNAGYSIDVELNRQIHKLGLAQLRATRPKALASWARALGVSGDGLGGNGDGLGGNGDGLGGNGDGLGGNGDGLGGNGDGLGGNGDGLGVGGDGLGVSGDGLGVGGDGLGIGGDGLGIGGDGLGVTNHFGIDHKTYFKMLGMAVNKASGDTEESKAYLSFVFMDSCASDMRENVQRTLLMQPIMRHLGLIYSPAANLNYRSIDWNNVIHDWVVGKMDSPAIQQHFAKGTLEVINFKPAP